MDKHPAPSATSCFIWGQWWPLQYNVPAAAAAEGCAPSRPPVDDSHGAGPAGKRACGESAPTAVSVTARGRGAASTRDIALLAAPGKPIAAVARNSS